MTWIYLIVGVVVVIWATHRIEEAWKDQNDMIREIWKKVGCDEKSAEEEIEGS